MELRLCGNAADDRSIRCSPLGQERIEQVEHDLENAVPVPGCERRSRVAAWVASVPSELPLLPFAMPIPWRAAAESFEQFLGKHGLGPAAVTDVEAAWRAFVEFSQTEIDGIAPADEDGDGFIIQWGRHSWDNNRLGLTLTRQLAVVDPGEQIEADDPDWQHLWQVELTMAFDDEPASAMLRANRSNSAVVKTTCRPVTAAAAEVTAARALSRPARLRRVVPEKPVSMKIRSRGTPSARSWSVWISTSCSSVEQRQYPTRNGSPMPKSVPDSGGSSEWFAEHLYGTPVSWSAIRTLWCSGGRSANGTPKTPNDASTRPLLCTS